MRTSVEFILVYDEIDNASRRFPITDRYGELDVESLMSVIKDNRSAIEIPKRLVEEILLETQALKITKITLEKVVRELKGGRKRVTKEAASVYWDTLDRVRNLDGLRGCDLGFAAMKYLEEQQEIQIEVDQVAAEFEELKKEIRQDKRKKDGKIVYF